MSDVINGIVGARLHPYLLSVPPKPQSKLRLVAGSDAVVIWHPSPKPNAVVRWLTRVLLRMEWLDAE